MRKNTEEDMGITDGTGIRAEEDMEKKAQGAEEAQGTEEAQGGKEADELDKLFAAAFDEMVAQDYAKRPKKFRKHRYSRRFRRNMDAMLRTAVASEKAAHGEGEAVHKADKAAGGFSLLELMRPVRSRRAIVVVLALALVLFGTTASGTNPIIIWLHDSWMEQHGDYVEIQKQEEGEEVSKEKLRKYELAELPEGYEVMEEQLDADVGIYFMTYADEEGNLFIFNQGRKDNKNLGNVTANRKEMEEVKLGDLTGFYVRDTDTANLVLSDDEYMLVFIGDFSKEEFLEIAAGLRAVD